jgi:hypothetical protein
MKPNPIKRRLCRLLPTLLAATLGLPSIAAADTEAVAGYIAHLDVNQPSADFYLAYHGRMFVTSGNKNSVTTAEYRWGGASCGSRTLTENQVAILQRALESNTLVTPRYQSGQGLTKCLVGFRLSAS